MIEHRAVERLSGGREAAGRTEIAVARSWVAARMVVGKHDRGATVRGSIEDDLADRNVGSGLVALVAGDVKAARMIVDMRNPQTFPARVSFSEAAPEEFAGGGKTVELERKFGTLVAHDGFGTSARA